MQTTNDTRSSFLEYFKQAGHQILDSGPLIPRDDPTLMFTNAGMVPFKNVFIGREDPVYRRVATAQKCVRAGGKHNDLDNVGHTARHHTFFEMLGNFSFGDYFKEEALTLAWALITKGYGLQRDRLLVTVHSSDEITAGLWQKIAGLSDDRIIRIATSDNFWSMGETGPCGPCSEIFYDHGENIPGGPPGSPDQDGDRFVEVWNMVFMQFERLADGTLVDLPKPCIDTGVGLERIAAVTQGKHDNYDGDLMRGLIEAVADTATIDPDGPFRISCRVIADHLRASCFLIAEGLSPSNEGRGYVLRRIMRRAMRHAYLIGCAEPLMHRLAPALIVRMGDAFPELEQAQALMTQTLKLEETRFQETLRRGLRLLDGEKAKLPTNGTLAGDIAFQLYDTYGFPLDLTQDALREEGYGVDVDGFDAAMRRARAEARKSWVGSGQSAEEPIWFELKKRLGASEFLGYSTQCAEGQIIALLVDGKPVEKAAAGQQTTVIANQTPFYAEAGGQVGDSGEIRLPNGDGVIRVSDTRKQADGLIAHVGEVIAGEAAVGAAVTLSVDSGARAAISANHSATHLLHKALRNLLGDEAVQKGSKVEADHLRFDVAHSQAITAEQISHIEQTVNAAIRANALVETKIMDPKSAVAAGAMALFSEKYGDQARVVDMGGLSIELCGGLHVKRTGDIGFFKIISEGAVGTGVRRLEAVTGGAALAWVTTRDTLLVAAATALKASPEDIFTRIDALKERCKKLEQDLAQSRRQAMASSGGGHDAVGAEVRHIDGVAFSGHLLEGVSGRELKAMADDAKRRIGSGVVTLVSSVDGKANVVVGVTDDIKASYNAVELVRVGAAAVGGSGGGGRADMAQAGGPNGACGQAALDAIEKTLHRKARPV